MPAKRQLYRLVEALTLSAGATPKTWPARATRELGMGTTHAARLLAVLLFLCKALREPLPEASFAVPVVSGLGWFARLMLRLAPASRGCRDCGCDAEQRQRGEEDTERPGQQARRLMPAGHRWKDR